MLDAATGLPGSQYGRYDIMVAEPFITLVTRGLQTEIVENTQFRLSSENPFDLLKNLLCQHAAPHTRLPFAGETLPFAGGALGYFSYDLGRRLEKLPSLSNNDMELPEMMIGIYDWAIVVDHREKTCQLVSHGFCESTVANWESLCGRFEQPYHAKIKDYPFIVTSPIESNLLEPLYKQAFAKIKAYIKAGDCYQVNLAQRFSAKVQGDSWHMYKKLRTHSPAPFMAFMQLPLTDDRQFQVLSNSPERFIQVSGNHVETRPIKGTRPRSNDSARDLAYSNELLHSDKDKAENVMIVDLLRNDLSKSCSKVKATKLFQLQSFANVHHLVSIVVGKLAPNKTAIDVLRDSFPGGSITGAPKLRAMQIIEELEPHRRGIYCGSIAYIGFDGNMDSNIAIRTAVSVNSHLFFYAGGGIVADSDASKEYAETLDKASNLITIMNFFMRR
jgi:para-aminobenzoate synthetase component 1